jgi:hypothetical protein
MSEELEATYTLVVEDGALVVQHRRMDDMTLAHIRGDKFSTNRMTVEFIREDSGEVVGFTVDAGRTTGVRFDRVH